MTKQKRKFSFKVFAICILSLLIVLSIALDIVYIYLDTKGEVKVVDHTFEVGLVNAQVTDNTKYFCEVNYFAHNSGKGKEMFEVKFNYLIDENGSDLYSQGIQYVSNNTTIEPAYYYKNPNYEIKDGDDITYTGSFLPEKGTYINHYATYNDTTVYSTNKLDTNPGFKVTIGDEIYKIKFRGDVRNEDTLKWKFQNGVGINLPFYHYVSYQRYYFAYDVYYFMKILYKSIKPLPYGTNNTILFEFGNIFDYYKYDKESASYFSLKSDDVGILQQQINSYYAIKVNKSELGANQASDSIFNCINGSTTWATNNATDNTYYYTRSVVTVTELDFDLVETNSIGEYKLKLNDNFKNYYKSLKDNIVLDVKVNSSYFKKIGATITGFTDNAFDNFKVVNSNIYNGI